MEEEITRYLVTVMLLDDRYEFQVNKWQVINIQYVQKKLHLNIDVVSFNFVSADDLEYAIYRY